MADVTWRLEADCRNLDPDIWFPEVPAGIRAAGTPDPTAAARAICRTCPVQAACLTFAIVTRQDDGIWGGTTEAQRRRMRRQKGRRAS